MYYNIAKKEFKGDTTSFNYNDIAGYKVTPKTKIKDGIEVTKMTIVKPEFIKKIIKKKVRLMLENLEDDSDSDDTRKALGHVERYRKIINEKYSDFLDSKYVSLLNQKIDILEREFKASLIISYEEQIQEYQYELQDEIEEKENRRHR